MPRPRQRLLTDPHEQHMTNGTVWRSYRAIITEFVGVQQDALLILQAALTVQHALGLQTSVVAVVIPAECIMFCVYCIIHYISQLRLQCACIKAAKALCL